MSGSTTGYQPQTLNYQARNANSVAVVIGDLIVAFAQTTGHSFAFGTEGLYGIGNALPQEIQQLRISSRISIEAFSLTQIGIQQLTGGKNIATLLANNQFDLHILAPNENQTLFTYVGCTAEGYSENIPSNRPVTQSIAFQAMDVLDPSGNSILNSNSAVSFSSAAAAAGVVAGGLGLTI